jgi:hypothetical protein
MKPPNSLEYLNKIIVLAETDNGYVGSRLAEDAYRNVCGWLNANHDEHNELFKEAQAAVVQYVRLGGGKGEL